MIHMSISYIVLGKPSSPSLYCSVLVTRFKNYDNLPVQIKVRVLKVLQQPELCLCNLLW